MQTYDAIQAQIARWALKNFGYNETPYMRARVGSTVLHNRPRAATDEAHYGSWHGDGTVVALDSMAPLLGMGEEVGELHLPGNTMNDLRDALADIVIYLCDYCARERVAIPLRPEVPTTHRQTEDPRAGVVAFYGMLIRCHLKRHQRIRGMEDPAEFVRARSEALRGLVWHLDHLANTTMKVDLLTLLNETWNNIVKKRDWNADAAGGGDHNHHGPQEGK